MCQVIYKNGLYAVPYNDLIAKMGRDGFDKLCKMLTVVEPNPSGYGTQKAKCAYIYLDRVIILPPNVVEKLTKNGICKLVTIAQCAHTIHTDFMPILSDNQQIVVDNIVTHFRTNRRYYLQMATGHGKTRVGVAVVCEMKLRTLIIVPTEMIGIQWMMELEGEDTIIYRNGRIASWTIVIINTAREMKYEFIDQFNIIILDEAHEYISDCNGEIMWKLGDKYVLGMSASPLERPDKMDMWICHFLGKPQKAHEIDGYDTSDIAFNVNVKVIQYHGMHARGRTPIAVMNVLARDMKRVRLICDNVRSLRQSGSEGIFIFAETHEYLDKIAKMLDNDGVVYKSLVGGVDSEAIDSCIHDDACVILTTYGYSRRGVNLTRMTAIILATPRKHGLNQIVGRILRRNSDYSQPRHVVDIVDMNSNLSQQYATREAFYKSRLYPITVNVINSKPQVDPFTGFS